MPTLLADGWFDAAPSWQMVLLGVGIFVATFTASIFFVGLLLVKLPADYFLPSRPRGLWVGKHPVLRITGLVLKNLAGSVLLVVGIIMLFTPGQGVLTILIGVMLLDFPGKRTLEKSLVGRPKVLAAINALRARYGKAPLRMEEAPPGLSPTCADPPSPPT